MPWAHPKTAHIIAHLRGVTGAVNTEAKTIAERARALLAEHRHDGDATITVTRRRTDTTVDLVDEAASAIELGHVDRDGKHVPGLNILGRAAGL
ncbi:DUF5403 family protein [Crossiella sp. SN42]|uniref:DUF5403 family protein n=1 Tax=Crossiella sp. SN42 TaxID=2944808 RepID=UPI00207C6BB1|nr:DUF5403 family protein [Crossiella sp. SN42]MCO1575363.1 DUF5403 family protein [Crossiella sp. SN42]